MRSWMDIPLIQSLLLTKKIANSIVLNGYSDNDIKFKNEKLIVDFTDAETGENIQHSDVFPVVLPKEKAKLRIMKF